MAYCTSCGYEYQPGVSVCPDCGQPLVTGDRYDCPGCGEIVVGTPMGCPNCGILLIRFARKNITCAKHQESPAIGFCVVCGTPLCKECSRTRQGKILCDNDLHMKLAFQWASVYSTSSAYEAEMVKANLESIHIPVTILSQNDRMYITTLGDLAVTEVMVPRTMLAKAEEFIRTFSEDIEGHTHHSV